MFKGQRVHQGLNYKINLSSGEKKNGLVIELSGYWNLEKSEEYLQTIEKKVLQN